MKLNVGIIKLQKMTINLHYINWVSFMNWEKVFRKMNTECFIFIRNRLIKIMLMLNISLDTVMKKELELILIKKKRLTYIKWLLKEKIVTHKKILHFYMR